MKKHTVFIDGSEGTTGLSIRGRLEARSDIELIEIDPEKRKDPAERAKCLNAAEISFLCLPDAAAIEAVSLVTHEKARIIDPSTAHRTASGWAYGLPELSKAHRRAIAESARVANPGCHATGFIVGAYPLVKSGLADADFPFTCHSVTGFSGGGKKMIAQYNEKPLKNGFESPRQYGLSQTHKHLPEMKCVCGLASDPVFNPIVSNFYAGMAVTIPLHNRLLKGVPSAKDVWETLAEHYRDEQAVKVMPFGGETLDPPGFIAASSLAGRDLLEIYVCGNAERTIVVSLFDNLGKGASGAAVQNMNIMLGLPEDTGLRL